MPPNHKSEQIYLGGSEFAIQDGRLRRELIAQHDALNLRLQRIERQRYDSKRRQMRIKQKTSSMTDVCQTLCYLQIELADRLKHLEKEIVNKYNKYQMTKQHSRGDKSIAPVPNISSGYCNSTTPNVKKVTI